LTIRDTILDAWDTVASPMFAELGEDTDIEVFAETPVDPLYGEAAATKEYADPVSIKARVKIERDRLTTPGGEEIDVDGRITFRTDELEEKSIVIDFGSLVTVSGQKYTVVHMEKAAQVGDRYLLTKIWVREK